jgi:subtilisin family serine protease
MSKRSRASESGRRPEAPTDYESVPVSIPVIHDWQWYMRRCEPTPRLVPEASIAAVEAWEAANTLGNPDVVVGFVDDGFDLDHPDLKSIRLRETWKLDDGNEPTLVRAEDRAEMVEESDFHGTACLGLALGSPREGVVGVAPTCSALLFRYNPQLDSTYLAGALKKIANKVDVLCLALGPEPRDGDEISAPLANALQALATGGRHGNGVVVCVAAGNHDIPVSRNRFRGLKWVDFLTGEGLRSKKRVDVRVHDALAAADNVLTVAASTSRNRHSGYSNWGQEVAICAPSNGYDPERSWRKKLVATQQAMPVRVPWNQKFDHALLGPQGKVDKRGLYRSDFGGTSAATAILAGAAALVRSVEPRLPAAQIKDILCRTADKIVDPLPDPLRKTRFGEYGPEGRCAWFGHGKVNVARAVREALVEAKALAERERTATGASPPPAARVEQSARDVRRSAP